MQINLRQGNKYCNMGLYLLFSMAFLITNSALKAQQEKIILLSEISFGNIYDDFGAPRKNSSYNFNQININGLTFEHGLGLHAPSELSINLDRRVLSFEAFIGLDFESIAYKKSKTIGLSDETLKLLQYDRGGSVIFKIIVDMDTVFRSGVFFEDTPAEKIKVDLKGAHNIRLICDNANDGYFSDFADWAGAKLVVKPQYTAEDFTITHHPGAVLVNHSGFLPGSPKSCIAHGDDEVSFIVVKDHTKDVVFKGIMKPSDSDLGVWLRGDFSGLSKEGSYYIQSKGARSQVFEISNTLYTRNIEKHLNFLTEQRSGDPEHGRSRGQHMDDGIRPDNGQRIDATGGWYDAADLRKATFIDIINLYALTKIYKPDSLTRLNPDILDEIKWGNSLFLKLQDSIGYMMYSIGFNAPGQANPGHGQRNYNTYTDNISGTSDDRPIQIEPSTKVAQMLFVISELEVAGIFRNMNRFYADSCVSAAIRCFKWSFENQECIASYDYGSIVSAATRLFVTTSDSMYYHIAVGHLEKLLALQETKNQPVNGWFNTWHDNPELAVPLNYVNWHLFGLCHFLQAFPQHQLGEQIKETVQKYSENYLINIAGMNPFNLLPYGVFGDDQGGNRKIGDYYFRYGVKNNYDNEWWNGTNSVIASQGYGLVMAARILNKPHYIDIAQSQLDWIYGCNPFNASTVTGIGNNQPDWFKSIEFFPPVPKISGAVMAGIGTDQKDRFVINPGSWNTAEYWLPPTAYIMLLLDALNSDEL